MKAKADKGEIVVEEESLSPRSPKKTARKANETPRINAEGDKLNDPSMFRSLRVSQNISANRSGS